MEGYDLRLEIKWRVFSGESLTLCTGRSRGCPASLLPEISERGPRRGLGPLEGLPGRGPTMSHLPSVVYVPRTQSRQRRLLRFLDDSAGRLGFFLFTRTFFEIYHSKVSNPKISINSNALKLWNIALQKINFSFITNASPFLQNLVLDVCKQYKIHENLGGF